MDINCKTSSKAGGGNSYLVTVMTGKPICRVHVSITVFTSMLCGRVPSLWACKSQCCMQGGGMVHLLGQVPPEVVLCGCVVLELF